MKYIGKLQLFNTGNYRFKKPVHIFIFRYNHNKHYYLMNKSLSMYHEGYDFHFALLCIYDDLDFIVTDYALSDEPMTTDDIKLKEYLKGLLK